MFLPIQPRFLGRQTFKYNSILPGNPQAIELSTKKMEELLASKNYAERADGKIHD